jgi:hypothetical protein
MMDEKALEEINFRCLFVRLSSAETMNRGILQSSITLLSEHCRKELDLKYRSLTLFLLSEEVTCEGRRVKALKFLIPAGVKPKIVR